MFARSTKLALTLAAFAGLASVSQAAIFSTPYTPGTPAVPATNGTEGALAFSYTGSHASSPTFVRPSASSSDTFPTAPTGSSGNTVPYGVNAYTPSATGYYNFYSSQDNDGFMHVYANTFNPASPLTNIVAGDDDWFGAKPYTTSRTNHSFLRNVSLTGGTTYQIVTSNFTGTGSNTYEGYVYGTNTGANPGSPAVPATPNYTIVDNTPAGVSITLNVASSGIITAFNSTTIFALLHNWAEDVDITLTHGTTTVEISTDNGSSADFNGNYTFVTPGSALPTTGVIPSGTYGSEQALSAFIGHNVNGAWVMKFVDDAAGIAGSVSAFDINVTIPEPTTLSALAGMGLIALRRRRA